MNGYDDIINVHESTRECRASTGPRSSPPLQPSPDSTRWWKKPSKRSEIKSDHIIHPGSLVVTQL